MKEIITIGYVGNRHHATRVVSGGGICPAVLENHGKIQLIIEYGESNEDRRPVRYGRKKKTRWVNI